ncbi:MAG: response regulator transcription factor [Betaproteobacteria bacterium]|nr:response regulator transcription factor [Betaproteobacteria bacterium]
MTAVVAEDEDLFREALLKLLKETWPDLTIAAICEDGGSALEAIEAHQPDVAFLDIRMPGLTGLDVAAAALDASPLTQIVFVTAYDQYAIAAFDRGAVDYLQKPVAKDRLTATIERIKARAARSQGGLDPALLETLMRELGARGSREAEDPLQWVTASVGRETRLIQVEEILYCQSDTKYTAIVTHDTEALVRTSLSDLMRRLNPAQFKQVHRATVVNMKAVASVARDESGRGTLKLKGRPETLAVSLTYMPLFKNM